MLSVLIGLGLLALGGLGYYLRDRAKSLLGGLGGTLAGACCVIFGLFLAVVGMLDLCTSLGKNAPSDAARIVMPDGVPPIDGYPAYGSDVGINVPFKLADDTDTFVFAEIVDDSTFQADLGNGLWVRLRDARRYPSFEPPLPLATRELTLTDSFLLPVQDLAQGVDTKYWIRFGLTHFSERPDEISNSIFDPIGRTVDAYFGTLYLPYVDRQGRRMYCSARWSQFSGFWVVAPEDQTSAIDEDAGQNAAKPLVREGVFVFEVPKNFSRIPVAKLNTLKSAMVADGRELAIESKSADPALFKAEFLAFFAGYESAGGDVQILLVGEEAPVMLSRDEMFRTNTERIEWGTNTGQLSKNSQGVKRLEIGGVPALLMDIVSSQGERLQTYLFFDHGVPKHTFSVTIKGSKGKYGQHEAAITGFVSSLKIDIDTE